jgi:hypothetical protein
MPIVRLRHIEPIGWLEDAPEHLRNLMVKLGVDRNGGEPLPGVDAEDGEDQGLEVYATGPDDDPARGEKLKRAALKPVPNPFETKAAE